MLGLAQLGSGPRLRPRCLAAAVAILSTAPLGAELLYSTDFDPPSNFTPGPDNWVGTEGWLGNSTGVGAHGIDDDQVVELGKTAYIGHYQPTSTLVSVYKHLDHDPVVEGTDRIRLTALLGIEDSTNGEYDSFFISFYNISGAFLGAVRFANEVASFGVWRLKGVAGGVEQFDTKVEFIHGELHLLFVEIDFQNNRWQADLDGIELFRGATFTGAGKDRDLGAIAVEWQLAKVGVPPEDPTAYFGDNWMLFADCSVWAVPPGEYPFVVDTIGKNPSGQTILTWTGEPGWTYQVEYSADLDSWHSDLPGSFFDDITVPTQLSFTDPTNPQAIGRFYRVARNVMP